MTIEKTRITVQGVGFELVSGHSPNYMLMFKLVGTEKTLFAFPVDVADAYAKAREGLAFEAGNA